MDQPMIVLTHVTKGFGSRPIVQDLSFAVPRGEIVGLLGPNGAGKTTTIRLINGVIRPDGGRITVGGYDPATQCERISQISGILTESAGFYMHMSGLENLRFFAALYGVTDRTRPAALLSEFGLAEHGDRPVGSYSTGMKRRLALAKALLHRPEILFLDEPTNGLDPDGIQMVLEQIRLLNRSYGVTVMLSSHLLDQVESVCHRYLFLDQGRLIEQGTFDELEAKYAREVVLQVETDLQLQGDRFRGLPARQLGAGRIELRVPNREAVPDLLRALLAGGAVYGATAVNRDLASLYFKIREGIRHE